jgi:hypothetical protein
MPILAPILSPMSVFQTLTSERTHIPELAIHIAMHDPTNHAHTAVAGPPEAKGLLNVAGTDPRTPRMEIA